MADLHLSSQCLPLKIVQWWGILRKMLTQRELTKGLIVHARRSTQLQEEPVEGEGYTRNFADLARDGASAVLLLATPPP